MWHSGMVQTEIRIVPASLQDDNPVLVFSVCLWHFKIGIMPPGNLLKFFQGEYSTSWC
jgi:hypothetical protein